MVQGNVVLSNSTKNLKVPGCQCAELLFFFNSSETEVNDVSLLAKTARTWGFKSAGLLFQKHFFLSSFALWPVSGNLSLKWSLSYFNQFSSVILCPAWVQNKSISEQ